MKYTTYPCVDLKVRTQNDFLQEGESKSGILSMTENGERFEFDELAPAKPHRNPKVWRGHYLSVTQNWFGEFYVHLKRMELHDKFKSRRIGKEITRELEMAFRDLWPNR